MSSFRRRFQAQQGRGPQGRWSQQVRVMEYLSLSPMNRLRAQAGLHEAPALPEDFVSTDLSVAFLSMDKFERELNEVSVAPSITPKP